MATFTFIPTYSPQLTKKYKVLPGKFGDGYEQRVGDGINVITQSWSLSFSSLTDVNADAIESFIDSQAGVSSFVWVPPGKVSANFVCRDFSRTYNGEDQNEIRITLEQVYG